MFPAFMIFLNQTEGLKFLIILLVISRTTITFGCMAVSPFSYLGVSEASRLESEVRRVERCARGGEEVRSRARLAAAAHARERRLAAEEKQHLTAELLRANGIHLRTTYN